MLATSLWRGASSRATPTRTRTHWWARANETALPKKTIIGAVPRKTRTVRVTLAASRGAGDYNEGYADNLSLTIGR